MKSILGIYLRSGIIDGVHWKYWQKLQIIRITEKMGTDLLSRGKSGICSALISLALLVRTRFGISQPMESPIPIAIPKLGMFPSSFWSRIQLWHSSPGGFPAALTCSSKEEICHLFILSTSSRQLASRTSSSGTSWHDRAGEGKAGVSGGAKNGEKSGVYGVKHHQPHTTCTSQGRNFL